MRATIESGESKVSEEHTTRRQFPRIPVENTVLIHRLGPAEQEALATTRQIGAGGVMVSSVEPMGVDSYLRLKITIGNEIVEATGRVVWENPSEDGAFDVGVAFISIDSAHHERIMSLLKK